MLNDEHPDPDESIPDIDLDTVSMLVPKAKEGSEEARAELLEHVQGYVRLMAKKNAPGKLNGKFGLSDVVQQSLAQVVQGFDQFRGDSASEFYGWLRTIVANEARKMQRNFRSDKRNIDLEQPLAAERSGSRAGFVPVDGEPTPRTRAIAFEEIESMRAALSQLPEDYAEVIRLRSFERLSFKEVAERMDRSFDSVTKLWYRAILKLEKDLNNE